MGTISRDNSSGVTANAQESPTEGIAVACNSWESHQEFQDHAPADEIWNNGIGQLPDWAYSTDADLIWSSLAAEDASGFDDLQKDVLGLETPPSSTDHTPPPEPTEIRGSGVPTTAPRIAGNISDIANCRCLSRSARLLDQLNSPGLITVPITTDQLIASYKAGAEILHDLHHCSLCMSQPEVMIVSVMVLQRMLALCEQMVDRQASGVGSEDCELRFGRILLTTSAEKDSLSHALISAQFRNFTTLLEMFKAKAACMPGSLALLQSMESRLLSPGSNLKSRLSSSHGN